MSANIKVLMRSALLLAALSVGCAAHAETWPTKNVTMIVPFSAGGSIDRYARGLAQYWEKHLTGGHVIIVENRAGASGLLGAISFLKARPDGNTIFVGIQPTLSMNVVVQDAPFKLDQFHLVNIEQQDYGDVVVSATSKYKNIQDFVGQAKAKPGTLSVAMIHGGGTSLFGLAMLDALKLNTRVVTFDGGGELRTNMLGNHSDVTISGAYGDSTLGDKVNVLAVASRHKFPGLENAVPITEAYPGSNIPAVGDSRFIAVHPEFVQKHPEAYKMLLKTYQETFNSPEYQEYLKKSKTAAISQYIGPEESAKVSADMNVLVEHYKDVLKNK